MRVVRYGPGVPWLVLSCRSEVGRDSCFELAGAGSIGRQSQPELSGRESAGEDPVRTGVFRARFSESKARAGTQQSQAEERFFAQHFGIAPESVPESQAVASLAGNVNPARARTSSR